MKTYEEKVPEGYTLKRKINFKDSKTSGILNAVGVGLSLAILIPLLIVFTPKINAGAIKWWHLLVFTGAYLIYVTLHEFTHALVGFALTKQKAKFGTNIIFAWCHFENVYFYKIPALLTVLAPFVIYSIALLIPAFLVGNVVLKFFLWVFFVMHFGGSVGDLYDAYLLIFVNNSKDVLMGEDKLVQLFYEKDEQQNEQEVELKEVDEIMKRELNNSPETQKGSEVTVDKPQTNIITIQNPKNS